MALKTLSIYYGTETGNSLSIAKGIADEAIARGITVCVHNIVNATPEDIAGEKAAVVIVISTWNRGKPPFFARKFCSLLEESQTSMKGIRFAVVGLGEEHYELFCATGKMVDAAMERLEGTRIVPRADLGRKFQKQILEWYPKFFEALESLD